MNPNSPFSIIFITANRIDALVDAVHSVWELPGKQPYEIIVVDNGSEDDTPDRIAREFPDIRLVRLGKNLGVAQGRNVGARVACGEIIIFIDDDALLTTPEILIILQDRFSQNPKLATVAFKIVNDQSGRVLSHEFPMRHHTAENINTEQFVSYFIGCGFAMRRDVFLRFGGFFEALFYALEEVDLSYRLVDGGYQILYCPEIEVRHRTPPEVRRKGPWYFNFIRSRILMVLRNLPLWAAIPHLLIWHVYLTGYSLANGYYRWFVRGSLAGWRDAPEALALRRPISGRTARQIWGQLSGRIFY